MTDLGHLLGVALAAAGRQAEGIGDRFCEYRSLIRALVEPRNALERRLIRAPRNTCTHRVSGQGAATAPVLLAWETLYSKSGRYLEGQAASKSESVDMRKSRVWVRRNSPSSKDPGTAISFRALIFL